jgi:hypothetical protein
MFYGPVGGCPPSGSFVLLPDSGLIKQGKVLLFGMSAMRAQIAERLNI